MTRKPAPVSGNPARGDVVDEFVRRPAVALEMAERDHSAPPAEIELLLLTRWRRGFGEAILAQVDAMVLAADGRVRSRATWR